MTERMTDPDDLDAPARALLSTLSDLRAACTARIRSGGKHADHVRACNALRQALNDLEMDVLLFLAEHT